MTDSVQQNATFQKPFSWSEASIDAAVLVAEDRLTDAQIARKVGVDRATLHRWKQHPEFTAKVDEHFEVLQQRARRRGVARLDRRMEAAEDRHRRMTRLIAERAKDLKGEVAGGETGLLVRTPKKVELLVTTVMIDPDGKETEEVARERAEAFEYTFDAALVRELRELEKQVAQDTGQWSEKRELSGPDGGPIPITAIEVVLDEAADNE